MLMQIFLKQSSIIIEIYFSFLFPFPQFNFLQIFNNETLHIFCFLYSKIICNFLNKFISFFTNRYLYLTQFIPLSCTIYSLITHYLVLILVFKTYYLREKQGKHEETQTRQTFLYITSLLFK